MPRPPLSPGKLKYPLDLPLINSGSAHGLFFFFRVFRGGGGEIQMLFEYTFCCKPTVRDSLHVQYESILCFYVVIFRGESVINYKTGLSKRKAQ